MSLTKDGFSRQMSQTALPKGIVPLLSSKSVERFIMKYAKASTRRGYLGSLARYFNWLRKAKGMTLTPDELILDNLKCVFESGATDILRKRRHLDLDEYINQYLVSKGDKDSGRITAARALAIFRSSIHLSVHKLRGPKSTG